MRECIKAEMVASSASFEATANGGVKIQVRDTVEMRLWLMGQRRMSRETGV